MITVVTGDNSFEIQRALEGIIESSDLTAERYDGESLELGQLPDLMMGATLFASKRLIIIKNLSLNRTLWEKLAEMIDNLPEDSELVLVEGKLDKRSASYKKLAKVTDIREFGNWDVRDLGLAVTWLKREAEAMGINLDTKIAQLVVSRVGVDQWQLFHALEKLALVDEVNLSVVESIIDISPSENVFNLLEIALAGDRQRLEETLRTLRLTEDPQRLYALLSGQVFQLAAVSSAEQGDNPASDFGVHPYVVSKLKVLASKKSKSDIKKIIEIFARADDNMKVSKAEPWILIESALYELSEL